MHFFLSTVHGECTCLLSPKLSSTLCLPLVADWWFHDVLKHLIWESMTISTGLGKHFHHRRVINPQNKIWVKRSVSCCYLIPLQLQQTNKKITSEWSKKKKCYIVICWFKQKYTYIRWIHTDAINKDAVTKTQEDFFTKIYTSHFIARVRKGCSRVACERELETEHKL